MRIRTVFASFATVLPINALNWSDTKLAKTCCLPDRELVLLQGYKEGYQHTL